MTHNRVFSPYTRLSGRIKTPWTDSVLKKNRQMVFLLYPEFLFVDDQKRVQPCPIAPIRVILAFVIIAEIWINNATTHSAHGQSTTLPTLTVVHLYKQPNYHTRRSNY